MTKPKPKKRASASAPKVAPKHDFTGKKCVICNTPYTPGAKFAEHHLDYASNITITVCYRCHRTIHSGQRWNPIVQMLKKDGANEQEAKTWGASIFAVRLAQQFDEKVVNPILERTGEEYFNRIPTVPPKVNTTEH